MSRLLIQGASPFEGEISYSRAVVCGDFIFVSGCTGYDNDYNNLPANVEDQCEFAFRHIQAALFGADAIITDIVRVRYLLPDRNDFQRCWPVIKKWLGDVKPAATMMQVGLIKEEMKIEIEVTAMKGTHVNYPVQHDAV